MLFSTFFAFVCCIIYRSPCRFIFHSLQLLYFSRSVLSATYSSHSCFMAYFITERYQSEIETCWKKVIFPTKSLWRGEGTWRRRQTIESKSIGTLIFLNRAFKRSVLQNRKCFQIRLHWFFQSNKTQTSLFALFFFLYFFSFILWERKLCSTIVTTVVMG